MTVFFGRDYVTQINDLVFTPTGGQFGPDATGFDYSEFFGVGEDELVGDTFDIGGPVIMDIPFIGETEVFRGRLFGELGVQFGLQIDSTLDPGSVDAILPYQTVVAFPDIDPAVLADGDIVDLFFRNEFRPGDSADSGFTTEFPSFTFDIGIATELVAKLAAEVGALGNNTVLTILDFNVPETVIPILSIDTNRTITAQDVLDEPTLVEGDFNPVELFGDTTPELIDNAGLDPAFNDAGELAGIGIPLNTFVSGPDAPDPEPVDASPVGEATPETDPGFDLASIDLGSIEIFVPNINTVSSFVDADGVFVTDPSRKAIYTRDADGNLTGIDRVDDLDANGVNLNEGNRDDVARLTLDLDGLITYATGGTFPPLELGPMDILDGSFGPINLDASFSYNLLDVELEAALPLEQEFTLTPKLLTQFRFFEANDDGSKGVEKAVDVQMNQKVLNFDETGTFRDAALEARLQQLAAANPIFGQDVSLFVDFDDGIPGAFTGQTASLGGRMIISRDGGATFEELVTGVSDPIAFSAPGLGQDQTGELTIDDQTVLGYRLFIGSGSAEVQEDYIIAFDKLDSIYVETIRETAAAISETPFLEDLNTLHLVYDADDTFVEVVTRAAPTITNRTGLEFDLSLLLSGLEASATFDASVDIGPITVGTGIDFDLGPLFDEKFELLNLDIVDLFNGSFQIEQEQTQSFVLGAPAPASDFGDAIVGTDGDDTIDGTVGVDEIIALGGEDLIDAGDGDDIVVLGSGTDTAYGGDGYDTIDLSGLEGGVSSIDRTISFGERTVTRVVAGERTGLAYRDFKVPYSEDAVVFSVDTVTSFHAFSDFETVVLSDLADAVSISNAASNVTGFDLGDGDDFVASSNAPDGLTIDAGAGDDHVDLYLPAGVSVSVDGGAGHDYLVTRGNFDLASGLTAAGSSFLNFESVQDNSANGSTLVGTDGANTISGGVGDDTLLGRGGNDLLVGGADDDVLIGGAGADSMEGGSGLDTADYSGSATSVFVDLDFGGVARGFRGEAQGDTFSSVENITGSDFDDIIIGNNAGNTLDGGDGNDRLQSQNGGDLLLGGTGDDLLNRGTVATLNGNFTNVYDGGDGFDLVAVDVFDRFTQTGSTTGTASFTYRTGTLPLDGTTTADRDVTIDYSYVRSAHVELTLDESGDGDIRYVEDDASDRLFATGLAGTARYSSRNEPILIVGVDLTFDVRSSDYDYNITAKRYANIIDDGISFSKVSSDDYDDVNGSGKVTDIGSPPNVRGGVFATEQVTRVEGLIGSQGNDRLTGNSHDNAFFGNGGSDLLVGGGGGDRMGFGEAQSLTDVFSFPGSSGSSAPGVDSRIFLDLEERLARMNPEGNETDAPGAFPQNDWTPVGKIQINASGATQDIGSFLWGQEGSDTLDMRFDRGVSFFPDLSTNFARVDLNVASGSASVNVFTGEQIQYGRAEWYDAAGARQSFATTFGVENVIGSTRADTITGDRNDNTIEGGDGADILDGDAGYDTLSYALAQEGVTLNFRDDAGNIVMDNGQETITGAGDATGDVARNFEHVVGSDHADTVVLNYPASLTLRTEFATFQAPISVQTGTTGFPYFEPTFSTTLAQRTAPFQLRAIAPLTAPSIDLGAGDDHAEISGGRRQVLDLGDGDDTATLKNGGHSISGGAGDDVITVTQPDPSVYADPSAQRTIIDGGEDTDTVVFTGSLFNRIELQDGRAIVTQGVVPTILNTTTTYSDPNPQVGFRAFDFGNDDEVIAVRNEALQTGGPQYELVDVEFVEINGQRIRIDNPDPIVDADKTVAMVEDEIDPYDLGLRIPQTDVDGGATVEIIAVPQTALLRTPDGLDLSVGDVIGAADMAALQIVAQQGFDPKGDVLTYLRTGDAPEDALSRQIPDTVRGVALNIASHLVEQTTQITTPVPPTETVALVRLNPGLDVGDLPLAQTLNYAATPSFANMPTGNFTFEMLFRSFGELDPDGPDQVFASYAVPGNSNEFLLYGYKDGRGLEVSFNGRVVQTGIRTDSLFDREMHRVSVRVDPAGGAIEVLIDGVVQFSQVTAISGGLDAGGSLVFGQEQDSLGGGFNNAQTLSGEIGDLRIWNSLRTDVEIQANAFLELADPSGEPDLAANFRADVTNQGVLVDMVGADHLAIFNSPDVVDAVLPNTQPGTAPGSPEVTTITQVVDQQGDPVTIRVESVPENGTVFYMGPDPSAGASDPGFIFGLEVEIPVGVGDVLTPEQLESLFFRADENFSGDPGDFVYSVIDDVAFRELAATRSTEIDNRSDGAANDGSATQVISFDIAPVNDAPEIGNVLFPISPGAEFESTVRVSDADGDDFTVALTTAPTFGTVVVNPDGSFTYQQNAAIDFGGAEFVEDAFEVTATEIGTGSAVGSIDPTTSGPQRQVIRIINPDLQRDIVFDPADPRFFDDDGNPVNIGGLSTDDVIIGHSGQDGLFGFGGHDSIAGREDADYLSGGIGNDTLRGEAGDDTLDGGEGADLLDGGEGIDMADYSSEQRGVTAILSSTGSSGAAAGDTITRVENLRGSDFVDFLTGDGVANTLMGGRSGDTLNGRAGDDWLYGEEDDDRLLGGTGNDTLEGGAGDDLLQGQSGEDVLKFGAGDGDDTAFGFELGLDKLDFSDLGLRFVDLAVIEAAGSSRIEYDGGTGTASVNLQGIDPTQITSEVMMDPTGAGGIALIEGDAGGNNLAGGAGGEDIVGGVGNDTLNARGGDDTMVGGLGDDQYFVEQAGDVVIEHANQGRDLVRSAISFTLGANIEVGTTRNNSVIIDITGNELDNELNGNDQSNVLTDDLGRDRLRGRGGDDTLNGGLDADVLEGGAGADIFVFDADSGIDLITDFEVGVDRIDVSGLGLAYADMRIQDGPLGAQVFLDLTPGSVDLITLNHVSASDLLLDSFITAFGANQPPIVGTPGNDNLSGSQIDDELRGLGGDDQVNGQRGADVMIGGPGDDTYRIDNPGDVVVELSGEGTDRVIAELDFTLAANVENASAAFGTGTAGASAPINLTGNSQNNLLSGNGAENTLSGLTGADNLQGKDGQDVIIGGPGDDILRGGPDADRFVFETGDGSDLIVDFVPGVDSIDLSATGLQFGDLTIQSIGTNATVAYGSDAITVLNVSDTVLDSDQFDFV